MTNQIELYCRNLNRLMINLTFIFLLLGVPAIIYGAQDKTSSKQGLLGEWRDFWALKLCMNLIGYSSLILPGYLLIYYLKKTNYVERGS